MYVEIIHHGDIGSRLWIVIDTIFRPEQIMWLCKIYQSCPIKSWSIQSAPAICDLTVMPSFGATTLDIMKPE
jgi:hypothetical protein